MTLPTLLLLAACDTTIEFDVKDGGDTGGPDVTDTDTDTDTEPDTDTDPVVLDLDGDGWEGAGGTGDDCDDGDVTVHPGAYDRPNDGVDADCSGSDRTFDGEVVDNGVTTYVDLEYVVEGTVGLDVALVFDTTCSMGGPIFALDVPDIAASTTSAGDARWSFSSYQDYAYGSMGADTDHPFRLGVQMTDDLRAVEAAIVATGRIKSGADAPESGMEAIRQALTGVGYDQDCDGRFDAVGDVPPFVSSSDDLFAGTTAGTYDPTVAGSGELGGVGFRAEGQAVVVVVTDNYMRDPDSTDRTLNSTPGGCADDAGASAVVAAATERNAWIVGILVNGTLAQAQFEALADASGFRVDADRDGRADDAPVYNTNEADLNATIAAALDDVAVAAALMTPGSDLTIAVAEDPYGVVAAVRPSSFVDADVGDVLSFDLQLVGIATDVAIQTTIVLSVLEDGRIVDTIEVDVEIAPTMPG